MCHQHTDLRVKMPLFFFFFSSYLMWTLNRWVIPSDPSNFRCKAWPRSLWVQEKAGCSRASSFVTFHMSAASWVSLCAHRALSGGTRKTSHRMQLKNLLGWQLVVWVAYHVALNADPFMSPRSGLWALWTVMCCHFLFYTVILRASFRISSAETYFLSSSTSIKIIFFMFFEAFGFKFFSYPFP